MKSPIAVDFDSLRDINPDVVGRIYYEGTSINYPVLKGEDNDELDLKLIRGYAESDTGIEASNEDQFVLLATWTYDFRNAKCTLLCKTIELNS